MAEIEIYSAALCPLKQWWEAVATCESVGAIAQPEGFYLQRYAQLAQASKA